MAKKFPTISVVIPTWNRAETIRLAIDSVLAQTHPVLEILVCDDGSTDATKKLISEYKNNKVIWIGGKHSGLPSVPRNRGLTQAKGSYIAFLDSDDIWLPDKLALQLERLLQDGDYNTVITTNATIYNPTLNLETGSLYTDFIDNSLFSLFCLFVDNKIVTSSVLIHSSLQRKVGFFPEAIGLRAYEDYAYWLRVATIGKFCYMPSTLVRYRDDPGSSVRSHSQNHFLKKMNVLINYYLWVLSNYPLHIPVITVCLFLAISNHYLMYLKRKLPGYIYMIKNRVFIILEIISVNTVSLIGYLFIFIFFFTSRFFHFFRFLKSYIWKIIR